jgi:hypothetical protein
MSADDVLRLHKIKNLKKIIKRNLEDISGFKSFHMEIVVQTKHIVTIELNDLVAADNTNLDDIVPPVKRARIATPSEDTDSTDSYFSKREEA